MKLIWKGHYAGGGDWKFKDIDKVANKVIQSLIYMLV